MGTSQPVNVNSMVKTSIEKNDKIKLLQILKYWGNFKTTQKYLLVWYPLENSSVHECA